MSENPINHVADTAYWVAYHRAKETARNDAVFSDPFAEKLAGDRGKKIAATMPAGAMTNWVVVLRTTIIDRFISEAIARGVDTVVNLGAGLDARPFRLNLPRDLNWVEVDFPAMIEYKEKILAGDNPHCRLRFAKADLADTAERQRVLRDIDSRAQKTLILTEGVIPYLSEENVAALAADLNALHSTRYWISDYMTRAVIERRQQSALAQKLKSAPMLFNPSDWFDFFRTRGWQVAEMGYYADAARKHHRPMPLPLWPRLAIKLLSPFTPAHVREQFRKSAGFALLEKRA